MLLFGLTTAVFSLLTTSWLKGKVGTVHTKEACKGEEVIAPNILKLVVDWGEWSSWSPSHFTPRVRVPVTPWVGGSMNPKPGLDPLESRRKLMSW